jgi:hypothetical protein
MLHVTCVLPETYHYLFGMNFCTGHYYKLGLLLEYLEWKQKKNQPDEKKYAHSCIQDFEFYAFFSG